MSADLRLAGFDDLTRALQALATDSRDRSAPILSSFAEKAKAEIVSTYPSITGTLRAGVTVTPKPARAGVAAVVELASTAFYARMYEFGTVHARPHPTFLPIESKHRRDSVVAVADYVESQGINVRGQRD